MTKRLSEKLDISYAEDSNSGMINVTSGKTGILVAGTSNTELKTSNNQHNQSQIMYEMSAGGKLTDITEQFKRGALGGAIELRDGMVAGLREDLSNLSYNIANEVNKAHVEGFDRYSKQGGNFFEIPVDGTFDIENLKLTDAVNSDVGRIAAAARPNAASDNTTANVIHSLQFKRIMGTDNTFTFDNFYNSKVGEVGVMSQKSQAKFETQKSILDQIKNVREGVSGVSLDEEAQKMIEFQKSYEASARVIRMADEMFDTVLNLKRL